MKRLLVVISIVSILQSCSKDILPETRYGQFDSSETSIHHEKDTLHFVLKNPVKCPLRFYITEGDSTIKKILLPEGSSMIYKMQATTARAQKIKGRYLLGDTDSEIAPTLLSLPFPAGKSYSIIQGYNGTYSHQGGYSRYSIDFSLKQGDTVCAADTGFVVGVIKDYSKHGTTSEWRGFSNFITLYHPHSGVFTQYSHLKQNGALVKVGDRVKQGMPIGLSGKTGWTTIEHLHFNVLMPVDDMDGLKSIPTSFTEGYTGENLTEGSTVTRNTKS